MQSHLLQPLTAPTSYKVTFKGTDIEHKEFEDIKHISRAAPNWHIRISMNDLISIQMLVTTS